jgi:dTDP-4-amino-4,6-dideoxygalactose transaminase
MSDCSEIPFMDLVSSHQELRAELLEVFEAALDTAGFIGGPMVQQFEADFAAFCDVPYCVGVGSGTDAIRFALIAAGVRSGDIVITVPNTFIATAEAISQAGARPVFVDVDEATYNLDPGKLRKYIETECGFDRGASTLVERQTGHRVAAIVPVHLYGQPADMDPILEVADQYGLIVIEDACQAHGAEYFSKKDNRWRQAGSMGRAAGFSFYPGKNLGACGEGGAVTTNDPDLARKVRMLRDHGQTKKYNHDIEGYNGRLDAIQAGIVRVKLTHLPAWNEQRRQAACRYREMFGSMSNAVGLPYTPSWAKPVYHLYVARVCDRDQLQKDLAEARIGTGIHYPIPLHLQRAYSYLGYCKGSFPITERVAAQILSLPMFPALWAVQQRRVVERVVESIAGSRVRVAANT